MATTKQQHGGGRSTSKRESGTPASRAQIKKRSKPERDTKDRELTGGNRSATRGGSRKRNTRQARGQSGGG